MEKRRICLYTQTHWDREWYWEFEKYRCQLGSVARQLAAELEEGAMPVFHLDGQSCALEDIIAIQPDMEKRLGKLISRGKLRVGPWYVLADQMLVSGESLVRNLERGIKIASRYGDPLAVGYLPDTFGHTQDMPRILIGFGIDNAVVWRGVPELDQGPAFLWRSPDGSEVLAYLLPDGYYQTAFHEAEGKEPAESRAMLGEYLLSFLGLDKEGSQIDELERIGRGRSYFEQGKSALVPVGGDHLYPPVKLRSLVKRAREAMAALPDDQKVDVEVVDLETYLKRVKRSLPGELELMRLIPGELRDNSFSDGHCRAFMLSGVLSARLYLKRENRVLEHRLLHTVEPLMTGLYARGLVNYPGPELDHALKLLLLNHPHDSICGCSVDDVHRQMSTRSRSANHLLDFIEREVREEMISPGVHEWSLEEAGKNGNSAATSAGYGRWSMDLNDPDRGADGNAVFNFSGSEVSAPVPFKYSIPAALLNLTCPGHESDVKLDREQKALVEKELDKMLTPGAPRQLRRTYTATEVFGSAGGVPVYKDICVVEGLTLADSVPAFGVSFSLSAEAEKDIRDKEIKQNKQIWEYTAVRADSAKGGSITLANQFYELRVDQDGTLEVKLEAGKTRSKVYRLNPVFRDVADAGDSYNFDPVFGDDEIEASFVGARLIESGPLLAAIELVHRIDLPVSCEESDDRSFLKGLKDVDDVVSFKRSPVVISHRISTRVEIRACDPIVYFETEFENQSRDHRLEVSFDTGKPVKKTWSENHFSFVERPVRKATLKLPVPRGREAPLDRFPCQRFFVANGQVFLNLGLPEYAVEGDRVSLTVLRAFSMLSRKRLLTRGGGAGPYMPTPEGNCLGPNKVNYGWSALELFEDVDFGTKGRAAAWQLAERFENPLFFSPVSSDFVRAYTAEDKQRISVRDLIIDNEAVRLSAMYKIEGKEAICLRLLNVGMDDLETEIKLGFPFKSVSLTDLSGAVKERLKTKSGAFRVSFKANELVGLKIGL